MYITAQGYFVKEYIETVTLMNNTLYVMKSRILEIDTIGTLRRVVLILTN